MAAGPAGGGLTDGPPEAGFENIYGGSTHNTYGMCAMRHMYEYGTTSEQLAWIKVAASHHAQWNEHAFLREVVTVEQVVSSRMIADPLHLLDCCQESDGGVAIVVTSAERARNRPHPPVLIRAAAQGSGADQFTMTSYYRDELTGLPEMAVVAEQLWRQAGITADDVDVAVLYDHFTPFVLIQLEELGFCPRGEARHFIAGGAIELGGKLPINPNGGQLGEAYIHGMNGIAEGVRQVRGTSVNQVEDVEHVLVTAGTGVPTSGLVLGR
jgi:acetyl-CoA acetyltransferase